MTNPAGQHPDQYFAITGLNNGQFNQLQWIFIVLEVAYVIQHHRFHISGPELKYV
jgi:hypothetical protein